MSGDDRNSNDNNDTNNEIIIDRLDCINRNIARFRPDIREIIREEISEALIRILQELRKPKPYVERRYKS